jgi:hypothetical protein
MDVFNHSNRIAIHEAGHAVIGWIMKMHCDKNGIEGVSQIFHYYYKPESRIVAVCHFSSNRATNESASPSCSRSKEEAITDLAINIAGSATYTAYIDIKGDPDYVIEELTKYFSVIKGDRLVGRDHDFRYFSDIARFDLGIKDDEVEKYASKFNKQIVNIFLLPSVKESVELVAYELINLLTTDKTSLDVADIKRLEGTIFPKIEGKEVETEVMNLYSL